MLDQDHHPVAAVVALAGRRIDAAGAAPPRFPLEAVPAVRARLAELFLRDAVVAVVCSAACGADLIAPEEAGRLDVRRRIVLPFASKRFRETSVVDRPGDWGPVFDRFVEEAEANGDLVVLGDVGGDNDAAYAAANEAIVCEAQRLAREGAGAARRLVSVIVWEGAARPGSDASGGLRARAAEAGFEERLVLTG
jgi:hypothetical protein